jgi:hypothetical protein
MSRFFDSCRKKLFVTKAILLPPSIKSTFNTRLKHYFQIIQ